MGKWVLVTLIWLQSLSLGSSLVGELRTLLNSLDRKDPSRLELTLRLADALSSTGEPTTHKREAIRLYEEALTGGNGQYALPSKGQSVKISFQMAKTLSDLGEAKATALWENLSTQKEYPLLQREAYLRLAEQNEAKSSTLEKSLAQYNEVIALCQGTDLCSYAHYRKAWALRNLNQISPAISELQLALYDSKGQIREEALRDLLTFLPLNTGKEEASLELVEGLAEKLSRPELVASLSQAFYSAGNRVWGTKILAIANRKHPNLQAQMKLLEQYYGLRDWDNFSLTLETLEKQPKANLEDPKEAEKILKRVCVQMDGERQARNERAESFQRVVNLYLAYFPDSPDRKHFREGWIASEKDEKKLITQLTQWLALPSLTPAERIEYLKFRATAAEKIKDSATVQADLAELAKLTPPKEAREYQFRLAVIQYGNKELEKSLTHLTPLSDQTDTWGNKSRCMMLQIWGEQKKYKDVVAKGEVWAKAFPSKTEEDKKLCPVNLAELVEKSRFEYAASLGETQEALSAFQGFCKEKRFLPQSCANAKVLAVKLGARDHLYQVLRQEKNFELLASELEASGQFTESAKVVEESVPVKTPPTLLRIALLYELGHENQERDRVLNVLTKQLKANKKVDPEEVLVQTYIDAKLVTPDLLNLPWSTKSKVRLSYELQKAGKGTPTTKQILLSQEEEYEDAWSALAMPELSTLNEAQAKIKFYGKRSEANFNYRVAQLKKLSQKADKYLKGSSQKTRNEIAKLMGKSYKQLADEVLASPIPEGLEEAQIIAVQASLKEVSEPFSQKSTEYLALIKENQTPVVVATTAENTQEEEPEVHASLSDATVVSTPTVYPKDKLAVLAQHPRDVSALSELKEFYLKSQQPRLASYFEGRIRSIQEIQ